MRSITSLLIILLFLFGCSSGHKKVFRVYSGDHDIINTPVYVDLEKAEFDENTLLCLQSKEGLIPAQIENLPGSNQRIWWIVNLKAGKSAKYSLRKDKKCSVGEFTWIQVEESSTQLLFDKKPVIQYEHPVYNFEDIEGTRKPYHHVFEPSGKRLITKGPGGRFTHHRGIFYGYNRIFTNGDERIDIWHANRGERSEHTEVIRQYAGPVMGGHTVKIYWKDLNGKAFIEEIRDVRVFRQSEGETMIDFHSVLKAIEGPVRLEGDRQHAGVHFRAAQYVADNSENTKYIRPPAWAHVDPRTEIPDKDMHNLPWNAMHFKIEDKSYTVAYMSHPSNPADAEMSERLYGRFGEFFPYLLTANNPLTVNYRFWITEGEEPAPDKIELHYQSYAEPVKIKVLK